MGFPRVGAERNLDVARWRFLEVAHRPCVRVHADPRYGRLGAEASREGDQGRRQLQARDALGGRTRRAHSRLCAVRRAGSRHQALLRAGLRVEIQVEAQDAEGREASVHLRGACRHGRRGGARPHVRGVPRRGAATRKEGRIRHRAAHGDHGASVLRLLRLPRLQLLRRVLALRHSGRPQVARRHGARDGPEGHHGPCPLACGAERARRIVNVRRNGLPVLPPRRQGLACRVGKPLLRLRQDGRHTLPPFQLPLLARRVPFRRIPLRRRDVDAFLEPRAWRSIHELRHVLQRVGRRRCVGLPADGEPRHPRVASRRDHDCRGRLWDAGRRGAGGGLWHRLRFPHGDGRARLLVPPRGEGPRRRLADGRHLLRTHEQASRGEGRVIRRVA